MKITTKITSKGYQYLENDFFELCKTRKIGQTKMLLYIYLRGLYCRFQKPVFNWQDSKTGESLGISQSTLNRAREYLQKHGVITFVSGRGSRHTEYTMLGTVLLPVIKKPIGCRQPKHSTCRQNDDTTNTSYERVKNRIGVFQGMTKEEKEALQTQGIL